MGKLSKLELFGLWSGIIGLISDTIALITFFAGFWGAPSSTSVVSPVTDNSGQVTTVVISALEIPLIARTVLFLVLIYSWGVISWILARRSFRMRNIKSTQIVVDLLGRSVVGFGIVVLPIFAMWLITVWQSDLPSRAEAQRIDAEYRVQTGKPDATWCNTNDFGGEDCIWDKTDAGNWAIPTSFVFQGLIAGLLYLVFYLLMPVIYPDMAFEEMLFFQSERPTETPPSVIHTQDTNNRVVPLRKGK